MGPSTEALARDRHPEARTPIFEFYFRGTTSRAHERLIARADEVALQVARPLQVRFPSPTRVIVSGSLSDFRDALPARVSLPETALGVAFPEHRLIVLRNSPGLEDTFVHEASHIALLAATHPRRPPRWFIEGFAAVQAGEGTLARLATISRASVAGDLIPLRDLERTFPAEISRTDLAYAQSNEFVAYLLGTHGAARFRDLVARVANGEEFFRALERAYDTTLDHLEAAYVQDLRVRYNWVPIVTGTATLYFLMALVFVIAYARARARQRRILREWAANDAREDDLPPPTDPSAP